MAKLHIYLKGGQIVNLKCDDCKTTRNQSNELTGIEIIKNLGTQHLYLRLNDVSMITYDR